MKLNNSDRDAFVNAVMDDVPQVDYNEEGAKITLQWALARMPADVAKLYKKHPEWVTSAYVTTPYGLSNYNVPVEDRYMDIDAETKAKLEQSLTA